MNKSVLYLIVLLLLSIGGFIFLGKNYIELKNNNQRIKDNFKNAITQDSLKNEIYRIKTQSELEQILSSKKGLQNLLSKSQVKNKRIQELYYQQQNYIDSIKRKHDVSVLVKKIRNDVPAFQKWKDSSECLLIKGNVFYKNDSLSVEIEEKKFTEETVLIKHKGRRKPIKWLFGLRLGKREEKFTPKSKCGTNKITIIEKLN